jgi:hypothetical protein
MQNEAKSSFSPWASRSAPWNHLWPCKSTIVTSVLSSVGYRRSFFCVPATSCSTMTLYCYVFERPRVYFSGFSVAKSSTGGKAPAWLETKFSMFSRMDRCYCVFGSFCRGTVSAMTACAATMTASLKFTMNANFGAIQARYSATTLSYKATCVTISTILADFRQTIEIDIGSIDAIWASRNWCNCVYSCRSPGPVSSPISKVDGNSTADSTTGKLIMTASWSNVTISAMTHAVQHQSL